MSDRAETWNVDLVTKGGHMSVTIDIYPPFGIRAAEAEAKAIKAATACGEKNVRATASRFVRVVGEPVS